MPPDFGLPPCSQCPVVRCVRCSLSPAYSLCPALHDLLHWCSESLIKIRSEVPTWTNSRTDAVSRVRCVQSSP
eukprot:9229195-Alexandrium_andersonii.AAC.1